MFRRIVTIKCVVDIGLLSIKHHVLKYIINRNVWIHVKSYDEYDVVKLAEIL
jgi:hypothetical protein